MENQITALQPSTIISIKQSKLLNVVNWVNKNGPKVINSISDVGLAITGVVITLPSTERGLNVGFIILLGFALGSVISNGFIWKREHDILKLQSEIECLSCDIKDKNKIIEGYILMSSDIINNYLAVLSNDSFKLSDSERISLFKFDGNGFTRIGRYSKNPKFKENGRVTYPPDQGCIAHAWQNGEFFVDTLPDPDKNLKNWYKAQTDQCFMSKSISSKLTMKSRNIFACAIEDPAQRDRIAVLVIESIHINAIKPELIKEALNSTERLRLFDLINRMKDVVPDLRKAIGKGF